MLGVYAIVDAERVRDPVGFVGAVIEAGADRVQLRAKQLGSGAMLALARRLVPLCKRAGVPFIVNDRADVALACDADGVHVGQEDLPADQVRRLVPGRILGVSTHSLEQARLAAAAGADYIGFGPVFATCSKERPDAVVGPELLAAVVREVAVPVVAIGGIDRTNIAEVARAKARWAAVIGALVDADDPRAATRDLLAQGARS